MKPLTLNYFGKVCRSLIRRRMLIPFTVIIEWSPGHWIPLSLSVDETPETAEEWFPTMYELGRDIAQVQPLLVIRNLFFLGFGGAKLAEDPDTPPPQDAGNMDVFFITRLDVKTGKETSQLYGLVHDSLGRAIDLKRTPGVQAINSSLLSVFLDGFRAYRQHQSG
jgi:hypothetical protein